MFSASVGSAGASLHTRAWPLPEGTTSGEEGRLVRAPPPDIPEDWLREVDSSMGGRLPTRRVAIESRDGLRDYSTILHPGEHLSAAAAAGGAAS
eukprot:7610817-Pyramimonas_sp.AAC.1